MTAPAKGVVRFAVRADSSAAELLMQAFDEDEPVIVAGCGKHGPFAVRIVSFRVDVDSVRYDALELDQGQVPDVAGDGDGA